MKFQPTLKMARTDVEVDGRAVVCMKSSWVGHSSSKLNPGDFFIISPAVGDIIRLARMHYRLKSSSCGLKNLIVAQAAVDGFLSCHTERWIPPLDVVATCPTEHMDPEIVALFERRVGMWR